VALSVQEVRKARKPGDLTDGDGLLLRVSVREFADATTGAKREAVRKSWVLRVKVKGGRRVEMGLGSAEAVGLADVRELARTYRALARKGVDPVKHREAERASAVATAAKAVTFEHCAEAYLAAHEGSFRNAKHRQQWRNTLASAYVRLGALPVATVDVAAVMRVLEPIWRTKTETASRLRGRIEAVLAWATVMGYREGANPAVWRNNLDKLLPARSKIAPVEHHSALPYAQLPAFMSALSAMGGTGAKALAFGILTAARSGEVRGMTWDEVDLAAQVWTVPAARMKAKREHRVPLSDTALAILQDVMPASVEPAASALVFPGSHKPGSKLRAARPPMSDMTLTAVLKRMAKAKPPSAPAGLTAHGFRSTFRDWCGEQTSFPREVAEAALAHVVADKVEAAYARGDLFAKRAKLMAAWASYCGSAAGRHGEVVDLGRRRAAKGREKA
jgi:integrase